ncbi:MAG: metallophosphoesterase family protein [Candidatus Lokiarchaeota archaeon]|nr:metallophosphoesterase family protein [Candidatus Lokiarchaeota archaeon]
MSSTAPTSKDVLFYAVSLVGVAVAVILLSWFLAIMWYTIFMIHIALTIAVWVVYGILCIYCVYLAYRVIGYLRSKPVKDVSAIKHYVLPAIIILAAVITPFIVLKVPSWIEYDMAPHLSFTGDPARSMTLTWYSTTSYVGRATYGNITGPAVLPYAVQEPAATKEHVLTFEPLSPNTTYYYKIDGLSETWSFRTANETANMTRFVAISDIHSMYYPPMTPDIIASNPDFVLAVGDLTDYGASNADWNKYFELTKEIGTNYAVMTTIGNHDSMFFGDGNYLKYLTMPQASTGSEKYYHFKYNDVHFICLDLEWGIESYDAAQKAWFLSTLAGIRAVHPSDWIVVYDHCMHVSSGGFGNATGDLLKLYNTAGNVMAEFHQTFVDYGVNLVISGHDHHFEVSNWDGVVYAIVGTANTRLDSASATNNTCSVFYEPGHSGFAEISINGNTCTLSGHLYTAGGTLMAPFVYPFSK